MIDTAVEGGITLFDTADVYGGSQNEVFVGKALAKVRDRVKIATKFGFTRPGGGGKGPGRRRLRRGGRRRLAGARARSVRRVARSAGHRDDRSVLPAPRRPEGADRRDGRRDGANSCAAGKVRYLGLSEVAEATLRRAHKVHPITAVQNEYSPWSREPEKMFAALDELGVGFVAYSPLGRGFFTATINSYEDLADNDNRKGYPRFKAFEENRPVIDRFRALAERRGCSPAQLALAFVMSNVRERCRFPARST